MVKVSLIDGKHTPVRLTDEGKLYALIAANKCPDCGSAGFWAGPSGGLSQNIFCRNKDCRSGFNVTPMVGIADRIGKGSNKYYE